MALQPKSYKKFVASAATATLVATALIPAASAAETKSFSDVSSTYKVAVDYLVANDIANGTSDTTFGTTATITRGDAAVMIAKALKLDTAKAPDAGFKDVNTRVAGAVNALVEAKIVSGKTATTFAPDANITRQEMAKIVTNAYKLDAGTTKNTFTDVNSNWDGFVDALVANGITLGKTESTFASTASVTRGEFALFVHRSETLTPATPATPEVVSVSAINNTTIEVTIDGTLTAEEVAELAFTFDPALEVTKVEVKKAEEVKAAAVSIAAATTTVVLTTEVQKAGTTYSLTAVNGTDLKAPVKVEAPVVVAPAVASVMATNAKALTVTFNKAITAEDQAKAAFDIKRGTIAVTATAKWATDGKSVTLTRESNYLAGDYTVTVTGLETAEGSNVGTTKVEAQKVSSLEVTTDNVVKGATTPLNYKVYDQYGEELTKNASDFTWTVVNLTDSSRTVTPAVGTGITLNTNSANIDDNLRVTGLLGSDPTVKVVKEVKVSNVNVGSFELGSVVFEEGQERLVEASGAYDVEISYAALTNFDKEAKLVEGTGATIDNITFVSSKPAVIDASQTKVDSKGKLTVEVQANESGKVTLTALNNNTGATSSIQLEVFATPVANTVEFGEATLVAGDSNGTAKLPVTFFDQHGNKMAASAVSSITLATPFNVSITGAGTLTTQAAVSADGKYILFNDAAATKGSYTLTLTNKTTGASSNTTVAVSEARVPNQLVVDKAPSAKIVAGSTTTAKFKVIDQYGKEMASHAGYNVKVTKASAADSKLTAIDDAHNATISVAQAIAGRTITAGAAAATEKITYTLQKISDSTAIESKSFDIEVIAELNDISISADKEEYVSGENIELTVSALDSANKVLAKYSETKNVTVTIGSKNYTRNVTFVNGVAKISVPATVAAVDVDVVVAFPIVSNVSFSKTATDIFDVKVGAAAKLDLTPGATGTATVAVKLVDANDNVVTTFDGEKIVNITYTNVDGTKKDAATDAEGNVLVTFTAGQATINLADNLAAKDKVTVKFDNYTGTVTVATP